MVSTVQTRIHSDFYWLLGITLLFLGQVMTGTAPLFAMCVSVFAIIFLFALKAAGGITTLPGVCISFFAGQQVLVSQIAKALLRQPADTGLYQPMMTIEVYDLSIFGIWIGMLAVNALSKHFKPPMFRPETNPAVLYRLAIVTTALSVVQVAASHVFGVDRTSGNVNVGGIVGPLKTLTFLPYLAIASCTGYAVLSSSGRRCLCGLSYIAIVVPIVFGLISSEREQMFAPVVAWLMSCLAFKFRFKPAFWCLMLGVVAFGQFIVSPFALYARGFARTPNIGRNITLATQAFSEVLQDPLYYEQGGYAKNAYISQQEKHYWYYGESSSLDRFSIICTADGIIDATSNFGTSGWVTILPGIEMLVPRFLNPGKQVATVDNLLAHRTPGLVGKDDHSTGITLGFSCDAFSSFGWIGVLSIAFLVTFCMFGGLRFLVDLRLSYNIYALALIMTYLWEFSEGSIASQILLIVQGPFVLAVTLWVVHRLAKTQMFPFAWSRAALPVRNSDLMRFVSESHEMIRNVTNVSK